MRPELIAVIACAAALIVMTGALGLKTVAECDGDVNLVRDSQKMSCYQTAAITNAYICGQNNPCPSATTICDDIWVRFGSYKDVGDDSRKAAEEASNSCYLQVAKITVTNDTCASITQRDNFGTALTGDQVTRDTCYNEVDRLALNNTYVNNPTNLCAMAFLLPGFLAVALCMRR